MSLNTKLNKSIKKKKLPNTRSQIDGVKSVLFHHEATLDDTVISLGSLNVPSGLVNPTSITDLKLKQFSENLVVVSNLRGTLMQDISYKIITDQSIKLIGIAALANEVFSFTFYNHSISGALIADIRPDGASGEIASGVTDFNLGTPVVIDDLANQWPIQVFRNGLPMLRNVGNGLSDGNYQMINDGTGNCQIIRFNIAGAVEGEPVFWATHGTHAERPVDSVLQRVDSMNGVLEVMKDDLLYVTGFDTLQPTRYNGAPTNPDLKSFGDIVLGILNVDVPIVESHASFLRNPTTFDAVTGGFKYSETISDNGGPITVDNSTDETKWIASKACNFTMTLGWLGSGGHSFYYSHFNSSDVLIKRQADYVSGATGEDNSAFTGEMNSGDYLTVSRSTPAGVSVSVVNTVGVTATHNSTKKISELI